MLKIDYIELPTGDVPASKTFFSKAFGWGFADYGPEYQAFADAGIDGGLNGTGDRSAAPLVILRADDLEAALEAVTKAGGEITAPIAGFPGGRRFEFREPGGNEMGVWSET